MSLSHTLRYVTDHIYDVIQPFRLQRGSGVVEAVTPRRKPAVRHVTAATALAGLAPPTVSGGNAAGTRLLALAARRCADVTSST